MVRDIIMHFEATPGFEPGNQGFAIPRLRPLGYVAPKNKYFNGYSHTRIKKPKVMEIPRPKSQEHKIYQIKKDKEDLRMTKLFEGKLINKEEVAPLTFRFDIEGELEFEPGQFVMIGPADSDIVLLSRPFSVFSKSDGYFSVLFKVFGGWTEKFSKSEVGGLMRILAPCGTGFRTALKRYGISTPRKILFIAGGLGIASLFSAIELMPGEKTLIFGGRTSKDIILKKELMRMVDTFFTVTEDGSEGKKGFVTDLLFTDVRPDDFDVAITCGPVPMLRALTEIWKKEQVKKTPLLLAMEERMACGIGICFSCAVRTKKGVKLCCRYGPVFLHSELVFSW